MNNDIDTYDIAEPNPSCLMNSLRAFGYSTKTAIADLIDNSITAGASQISIQFDWNDDYPIISIADNGGGMSETELVNAMRMGSRSPLEERAGSDLGRFGLGLKTASFSQCRILTVGSRQNNGSIAVRCWNLDLISRENRWILLKSGSEKAESIISSYLEQIPHGTVVVWEELDKIIPADQTDTKSYQESFLDTASAVKKHLSLVFSEYFKGIGKVAFLLNGRTVEAFDPFMENHPMTVRKPTEYLYVGNEEVTVKPFILPHHSNLSPEEFQNSILPDWNDSQGFYIYRNNRLIMHGSWLLPELQKKEQYRLARVRINIGNGTDEEWGIDVRKSLAVPPVPIRAELQRIAKSAMKESSKVYRHRGKKLARSGKQEASYIWIQKKTGDKVKYIINRSHPLIQKALQDDRSGTVKSLLTLIQETIPIQLITSNHLDNEDDSHIPYEGNQEENLYKMMEDFYGALTSSGFSAAEALALMAGSEPFVYHADLTEVFAERKGIKL